MEKNDSHFRVQSSTWAICYNSIYLQEKKHILSWLPQWPFVPDICMVHYITKTSWVVAVHTCTQRKDINYFTFWRTKIKRRDILWKGKKVVSVVYLSRFQLLDYYYVPKNVVAEECIKRILYVGMYTWNDISFELNWPTSFRNLAYIWQV